MSELSERFEVVREQVCEACRRAGREVSGVRLLAVSKFHDIQDILSLLQLGQPIFGENYVQEALQKSAVVREKGYDPTTIFHMIGHVQRKKAASVVGNFSLVHSLDSKKLADALEKEASKRGLTQDVLFEVNIADEPQKSGVPQNELEDLATYVVANCPHLALKGLMCLPPVFDAGEKARPFFERLRNLSEALKGHLGLPLPELSMGMSGDFAAAISEGATIVRIGTALFGARPIKR